MELETWVPVSTLEFISCVILARPLNLSGLQHPHLLNGKHNTRYLPGLRGGLDENCHINVSLYYGSDKVNWHSKFIIINSDVNA